MSSETVSMFSWHLAMRIMMVLMVSMTMKVMNDGHDDDDDDDDDLSILLLRVSYVSPLATAMSWYMSSSSSSCSCRGLKQPTVRQGRHRVFLLVKNSQSESSYWSGTQSVFLLVRNSVRVFLLVRN